MEPMYAVMPPGLTQEDRSARQAALWEAVHRYYCTCKHYGEGSCPHHTFDMA